MAGIGSASDKRSPLAARSPSPDRVAPYQARGAEGTAFVHHEKERRHPGPTFASGPPPCQSDGRGHRRGLDGPSMPNQL